MKSKIFISVILLFPIICFGGGRAAIVREMAEAIGKRAKAVEKVAAPTAASSADSVGSHFLANVGVRITANCLFGYTTNDKNYTVMQRRCNVRAQKITQCIRNNTNASNLNNTSVLEDVEKFCTNVVK